MKIKGYLPILILVFAVSPGLVMAEGDVMKDLGSRAAAVAMNQLDFEKGDENILAMTDAGYAMIGGQTTEAAVDGLSETCGCTIGKANLLMVHRSKFSPLWFFFYDKESDEAVYLQVNESADLAGEDVFSIVSKEMIDAGYMLENPKEWNGKFDDKVFGGNEFSLTTIANVWSHPNTTYDLLQATMLHNHICPGLTSGYMISKYVEENLPLETSSQSYKVIACPVWCKEDAFQAIWDATPGKRALYVKGLTGDNMAALPDYAKNAAGLYIRWNKTTNTGDGLVVGFNWTKSQGMSGIKPADFKNFATYKWWWARLKMDLDMIDYINNPETVCTTIMEFQVNNNDLTQLQEAGVNPYVYLGIVEAPRCLGVMAQA